MGVSGEINAKKKRGRGGFKESIPLRVIVNSNICYDCVKIDPHVDHHYYGAKMQMNIALILKEMRYRHNFVTKEFVCHL